MLVASASGKSREIDLWCELWMWYISGWSSGFSRERAREWKTFSRKFRLRKHFRARDREKCVPAVKIFVNNNCEWKHDREGVCRDKTHSLIFHLWFSVKMATSTQSNRRPQQRYTRSSTTSVTQLLSDSCNSLLQRFRRPPSEKLTGDKTFSLATNR